MIRGEIFSLWPNRRVDCQTVWNVMVVLEFVPPVLENEHNRKEVCRILKPIIMVQLWAKCRCRILEAFLQYLRRLFSNKFSLVFAHLVAHAHGQHSKAKYPKNKPLFPVINFTFFLYFQWLVSLNVDIHFTSLTS